MTYDFRMAAKKFHVGAKVKIIDGPFEGETGKIVGETKGIFGNREWLVAIDVEHVGWVATPKNAPQPCHEDELKLI